MWVYIYQSWIETPMQNDYIGEYWWKPWANTLAYYPLTSTTTVNDMSGNNKTLTNQGGVFWTYNGVDCVYCWNSWIVRNDTVTTAYIWQTSTMSAWVSRATWNSSECWIGTGYNNWPYYNKYVSLSMLLQATRVRFWCWWWNAWHDLDYSVITTENHWYHLVQTFASDGTRKCYFNWTLVGTWNQIIEQNISWFSIVGSKWGASEQYYWNWYASEIIIENKTWTDAEILDYYNQTKANYWL